MLAVATDSTLRTTHRGQLSHRPLSLGKSLVIDPIQSLLYRSVLYIQLSYQPSACRLAIIFIANGRTRHSLRCKVDHCLGFLSWPVFFILLSAYDAVDVPLFAPIGEQPGLTLEHQVLVVQCWLAEGVLVVVDG